MSLHLITAPSADVIDVQAVRAHLRIDAAEEDEVLETYIASVVELIDGGSGVLGRCLEQQTWEYRIAGFCRERYCSGSHPERIGLPLAPLISVVSIKYLDQSGVEQTLLPAVYDVIDQGEYQGLVQPAIGQCWPATICHRPDAVRIQFSAGYASPNVVPQPIRNWMLREIGKRYEARDTNVEPDWSDIMLHRSSFT